MSILMIFIDGLGIGLADPQINPCAHAQIRYLAPFENNICPMQGSLIPADASLDVPGLPQSATGQTTLLTGINAAKAVGHHLQGFPNEICRNLLKEKSILKQITKLGLRATFANAYRPIFFTLEETRKWRFSATTVANLAAGLDFRTIDDCSQGKAIYHDFSNQQLIQKGFQIPEYKPEEAGQILLNLLDQHEFVLYEFFLTDHAGHKMDMDNALFYISQLDNLIGFLVNQMDLAKNLFLIASDHGNIEDLSIKTHTTNPAMTIAWGEESQLLSCRIQSLTDITPAIIDYLSN